MAVRNNPARGGFTMMTNVGLIDRALRLLVGFALLAWIWGYFGRPPHGAGVCLASLFGGYLAITGLLRYCPLLALTGVSTSADDI